MSRKKDIEFKRKINVFLTFITLFSIYVFGCYMCTNEGENRKPKKNEAWVISRGFVKRILTAPSTADFPFEDVYVYNNGDTFTIIAPVDAQNSFGAKLRTKYACKLVYMKGDVSSESSWALIDVVLE
jgi:hypothetical protein